MTYKDQTYFFIHSEIQFSFDLLKNVYYMPSLLIRNITPVTRYEYEGSNIFD